MDRLLISLRIFFFLFAACGYQSIAQNLHWAKDIGNTNITAADNIVVDRVGNSYTVGTFSFPAIDIDPGAGTYMLDQTNGSNYILKLDSAGDFVWAQQFKYSISALTCDDTGSVFICGYLLTSVDVDPDTIDVVNFAPIGNTDGYVIKLDSSGDFQWLRQLAGIGSDCLARGIEIDPLGSVIISGVFGGTVDFDPGINTNNLTTVQVNTFVEKLNGQGDFLWVEDLSAVVGLVDYYRVRTDPNGNIYCVLPHDTLTICKYDSSGAFLWARRLGDEYSMTTINDIVVDKNGNVYATGTFNDPFIDFDPGPGTVNFFPDDYDAYVYGLDATGNFIWAKCFTGAENQEGKAIAVDSNGSIYITGYLQRTADFDPNAGVTNLTAVFNYIDYPDVFLVKLSPSGNLLSAKSMGGKGHDESFGMDMDASGCVFICGIFNDTADYDPNTGIYNLYGNASYPDAFIIKLSSTAGVNVPLFSVTEQGIFVYPNPATEQLTIKTSQAYSACTISNSIGQVMIQQALNGKETGVNIKSLAPGVYYISLQRESGTEVRKFVKM